MAEETRGQHTYLGLLLLGSSVISEKYVWALVRQLAKIARVTWHFLLSIYITFYTSKVLRLACQG